MYTSISNSFDIHVVFCFCFEAENLAAAAQSNQVNASNGGTPIRHRSSIYKQAPLLAVLNEQVNLFSIVLLSDDLFSNRL